MDGALSIMDERVLFAREIKPEVNALLQSAVTHANDFDRARALLYEAKDLDPEQLEIYVALYKFLFYRGHFAEAEQVALDALQTSARRGGFSAVPGELSPDSADWSSSDGPERMYLYSLKALSFIRLRKGEHDEGRVLLKILDQLDPNDQVGGSVIRELAEAL